MSANYTPAQQEAVETTGVSICVDAGAGSGKTRVLVGRILALLESGKADLNEIVAITFTDKAAAEMKDRLRAMCRERAPQDDSAAMTTWRERERRVHSARISTFHTFCSSLLRENALEIGLDPDFTILSDPESILLRNEIVRDTVHDLVEKGDPEALRFASEHGVDVLIREILSGLGRGSMMKRLQEIQPNDSPKSICALWRETSENAHIQRLMDVRSSARLKTFRTQLESFAGEMIADRDARETLRLAMLRLCDCVANASDSNAVQGYLDEIAGVSAKGARKKNWSSEENYALLSKVQKRVTDFAKNLHAPVYDDSVEVHSAELTQSFLTVYSEVARAFDEAKAARTATDFDDLIEKAHTLLTTNDALRDRVASGIKFLLIDEFQDTDSLQLDLAKCLAAKDGRIGPEVFIVGDAKQSIYDFRGAETKLFQEARADSGKIIALDTNFRSQRGVLSFVNEFFSASGLLHAVEPEYSHLHAARNDRKENRIEFLIPEETDEHSVDDYRRLEADMIATRLIELCGPDSALQIEDSESRRQRRAQFGDAAILFRSTSSVHIYEDALRNAGVPFYVVSGAGFYERQEIHDLRNLLQVIIDPWDETALLGFLRSPIASMKDQAIMEMCSPSPEPPHKCTRGLASAFRSGARLDEAEQNARFESARTLVANCRARADLPLSAFLRHVLSETSFEAILLSQHHGAQKAGNVRKLIELAEDFSSTQTLRSFVRYLDEVSAHEIREGDATQVTTDSQMVTLMTIHKAKGLEFPLLVLADTARGLQKGRDTGFIVSHRRVGVCAKVIGADGSMSKPAIARTISQAHEDDGEAEHARVLYVALTRARDHLIISGGPKLKNPGSWLEHLDDQYDLFDRADGDSVSGPGWQGVVRRKAARHSKTSEREGIVETFDFDVLLGKTKPIETRSSPEEIYSVSAILDALEGVSSGTFDLSTAESGADAMLKGSMVHRLLERWTFEQDPPVQRVLREFELSSRERADMEPYLSDVATRFQRSDTFVRLRDSKPLEREIRFYLKLGNTLMRGGIDVVLSDGTLIDYKTGRNRRDSHARYEDQLRLYAAGLFEATGRRAPVALLHYLDSGDILEVDVSQAALNEVLARAAAVAQGIRQSPAFLLGVDC